MSGRAGSERLLVLLLRLGGVITGSAIFAVFLPTEWMAATHERLGLGPYPGAPITDYLTRSLSAFYAAHGALLFLAASDVRRFRPLVLYCGVFGLAMGALTFAIDVHAGLPAWWTWGEGPWVFATGVLVLSLARGVDSAGRSGARPS